MIVIPVSDLIHDGTQKNIYKYVSLYQHGVGQACAQRTLVQLHIYKATRTDNRVSESDCARTFPALASSVIFLGAADQKFLWYIKHPLLLFAKSVYTYRVAPVSVLVLSRTFEMYMDSINSQKLLAVFKSEKFLSAYSVANWNTSEIVAGSSRLFAQKYFWRFLRSGLVLLSFDDKKILGSTQYFLIIKAHSTLKISFVFLFKYFIICSRSDRYVRFTCNRLHWSRKLT